jgi:hypothetical protein
LLLAIIGKTTPRVASNQITSKPVSRFTDFLEKSQQANKQFSLTDANCWLRSVASAQADMKSFMPGIGAIPCFISQAFR